MEELEPLIEQPRESLAVELKAWLDLSNPKDQSKIIKALIALRNNNGGYLILGFNDKTLEQDKNAPPRPSLAYHSDNIQALITKYSSQPFEVKVEYIEKEGITHPIFIVPSGFKSVVAAKADLFDSDGKTRLISIDDVYIRTLSTNHVPSTARPTWKDWPQIIEKCFDNREADIGNFLRRHLGGLAENLITAATVSAPSQQDICKEFFNQSIARFHTVISERKKTLPEHGSWSCALVINGQTSTHRATSDFLRMLDASNPRYSGWPVWLNSERFPQEDTHPYVDGELWESLIILLDGGWTDRIDFYRFDPKGQFFIRRALQDDIGGDSTKRIPLKELEFAIAILRTAETVAVGIAFAKAMGYAPESTSLCYHFSWDKLKDRTLGHWANPERYIPGGKIAYQDSVQSTLEIPLDTPESRIPEYVKILIDPLFEVFKGFAISQEAVNGLVTNMLGRRF